MSEHKGATATATKRKSIRLIVAATSGIVVLVLASGMYFLSPQVPLTDEAPATETQQDSAQASRNARLTKLLAQGDKALLAGNLINPPQQNALVFYEQALAIDPANVDANRGIKASWSER